MKPGSSVKEKIRCPKCNKVLRSDMNNRNGKDNLKNHLQRCYKCKYCRTYRVWNTGHSENCNKTIVAKRVKDGLHNGYRRCPVCTIPFKNVIEHLELQHHLSEEEVDKYRLIATRAQTPEERIENRERLKSARKMVRVTNIPNYIIEVTQC